jgi:type VI secretion system protein ImpL
MLQFLKRRGVLIAIGLILLSVFIWYAGPYFAFADFHPLASASVRWLAIALLLLMWPAAMLWKQWQAVRKGAAIAQAVIAQQEGAASGEVLQLRERFAQEVGKLKQSQAGRRGLYELPWYAIIGAPGSGKTTLLANSGLTPFLADSASKEALRGIGGTRSCEWWFTQEAVLLDTAGRYTTQDHDSASDRVAWKEFLSLLCKYRRRRPLNGVIVTLSAHDLLTQTPGEREAHIEAIRNRVKELQQELRIQLPIYVWIAKCDLIAGFAEYFDDLGKDGRAQPWGVTFNLKDSTFGTAVQRFSAEFDLLMERINQRVLARLNTERDNRRRTSILGFGLQMSGLKEPLGTLLTDAFAANRYEKTPMLRGVYFTSAAQHGTPIDRLLISMGVSAVVHAPAHAVSRQPQGYFIEHVLRKVMFTEAGIAGVNRRLELQKAAIQVGAYASLGLLAAGSVVALSFSYAGNKGYLQDVADALNPLSSAPTFASSASMTEVLPRLDALGAVAALAGDVRYARWRLRWGLYQPASIAAAARDAYARELNAHLLPQAAQAIKARLLGNVSQPDKLYEYLKAYLMFSDPTHMDKVQLGFLTDIEWQASYPDSADRREQLSRHFRNLLDLQQELRAMPADPVLVEQARNAIRNSSLAQLMYSRLKLKYSADLSEGVRLDTASGVGAQRVLMRKSGRLLSEPVAALYTPKVFGQVAGLATVELLQQFREDAWVMDGDEFSVQNATRLMAEVMDIYERDYISAWDGVLNDVQLVPFKSVSEAGELLGILSGPTSPLRGLLTAVSTNTLLVTPVTGKEAVLDKKQQDLKARLGKLFTADKQIPVAQAGAMVTAHFEPIRRLVTAAEGQVPIDRVLQQMGELHQQLLAVGSGVGDVSALQALSSAGRGGALRTLQQEARLLPAPLAAMLAQLGGRSQQVVAGRARGELEARYRTQVLNECNAIATGRYPFDPTSSVDVPVADFARLFGPSGIYAAFFKEHLAGLVDTSRVPWTWRPGSSGPAELLRQFEAAQRIQESFFAQRSERPEVRFSATVSSMDADVLRFAFEVDGQSLQFRHGPQRTIAMTWPGPAPGLAAYEFEIRRRDRTAEEFRGPWALFRLLGASKLQRESDSRYLVSFEAGGLIAVLALEPTTIRNPLAPTHLSQFRCAL